MALWAVIAVPVRNLVARAELVSMDREWAEVLADDTARFTVAQELSAYSGIDPTNVAPALVALFGEERQRLLAVVARLHRAILVDHDLVVLRSDLLSALNHRVALLAESASTAGSPGGPSPDADAQTEAGTIRVERDLVADWRHRCQPQPTPIVPSAPYRNALAVLARLRPWLAQSTGVDLLSGFGEGLARLDIDTSQVVSTTVALMPEDVTPRRGYLAYASDGDVWMVAPDGTGVPRVVAAGDSIIAAIDPSAVWVVSKGIVSEIDQTGRVLVGPVEPPGAVEGATSDGLVVSLVGQPSIEVWNPVTGGIRCPTVTNGQAFVMASESNSLAWGTFDGVMRLIDVNNCAPLFSQHIGLTLEFPEGAAVFSPDGRTLAVATLSNTLELVDVATGRVSSVPIPVRLESLITAIAWTPDGSRLFWLTAGPGANSPVIETWQMGDSAAQPVRLVGVALAPPLFSIRS